MTRAQEAAAARLNGSTWTDIADAFGYANSRSARTSVLYTAETDEQRQALVHAAPAVTAKLCSVVGCERRHYGHGWCKTHYARWQRHGTTDDRPRAQAPTLDYLWAGVARAGPDECWEWQKACNQSGYGIVGVGGFYLAHRLAWTLTRGRIGDGLIVCHHCDNPPCCNPAHLFLGTHQDNAADKVAKGRQQSLRGCANGFAKLDEDDVRSIRRLCGDGYTQASVGERFDIGQSAVSAIVRRERWGHVT